MSNFNRDTFSLTDSAYPVPVILDTDTFNEIDDQFALIYAISDPKINLVGVTAAPFFNELSTGPADGMEKSYREIIRILDVTGQRDKIPYFRGATEFQPNASIPVVSDAAHFIIKEAKAHAARGEKLFVCAIGAITNVAAAILMAPEITDMIVVIWLGGNPVYFTSYTREFNLQGDITAAQTVFDSNVPLIQLPCSEVVEKLLTTAEEINRRLPKSPAGDYLRKIYDGFDKRVIRDVSAIATLTMPEAIKWEIVPRPVLHDDCTWSESVDRPLMKRAVDINRDEIFNAMFSSITAAKIF